MIQYTTVRTVYDRQPPFQILPLCLQRRRRKKRPGIENARGLFSFVSPLSATKEPEENQATPSKSSQTKKKECNFVSLSLSTLTLSILSERIGSNQPIFFFFCSCYVPEPTLPPSPPAAFKCRFQPHWSSINHEALTNRTEKSGRWKKGWHRLLCATVVPNVLRISQPPLD